jgi:hypothetical protein
MLPVLVIHRARDPPIWRRPDRFARPESDLAEQADMGA